MESTDGSLAWRNLISSSVLGGFQGQGEITGGKLPGGKLRGRSPGSSPRPLNSAPLLYLHHHHCQSQTIIFIGLLYLPPPGFPLNAKNMSSLQKPLPFDHPSSLSLSLSLS